MTVLYLSGFKCFAAVRRYCSFLVLVGLVFNGSFVHRILTEASFLPKERRIASVTSLVSAYPFSGFSLMQ